MLLASNINEVIENIKRFQIELNEKNKKNDLVNALGQFSNWFAYKDKSGHWIFGPSKFIGYKGISLEAYENKNQNKLDGRQTDAILHQWKIKPSKEEYEELREKLSLFLNSYRKRIKKTAKIYVLSEHQDGEIEQSKAIIEILKTWDKEIQKKVINDINLYKQSL
jgi:ElaB/YqjD/DUF883 family membrane-anchored ribosome-binding protein